MNSAINNLNQLGGQFLSFAWPMLWQSSLLMALVFAADVSLARKIRASVRHALWLVVLAKLLLPPTLALPTGAAWWLFPAKPVTIPAATAPAALHYVVTVDDAALPTTFVPEKPVPQVEPPKPKLNGAAWALLVSGVVSAGLLAWLLWRWGQLAQKIRGAGKPGETTKSENIEEVFEAARRRAGLGAGARLKLVAGNMSPAVCGLFRPVILLPRLLVEQLGAKQLEAVLLHEMIHLRRRDIWVNCAQSLLQIFYWWHPLVWAANARMRRVREEAVDDAVMLALAEDAEIYAPTLLEVAKVAFRRPLLSLGLVGIMESRSALRQRIERLVDFRAPRQAGLTLVSLCGIFVFSAVAVPMGQGPAPVVKEPGGNVQVLLGNTLTNASGVRIARLNADGSLDLNFTNFADVLGALKQQSGLENLGGPQITTINGRGENQAGAYPAQTFAFNETGQTGSSSANSAGPDAPNSATLPVGRTNITPQVIVTGEFYQISANDFEALTAGLQFTAGTAGHGTWWSGARDEFSKVQNGLRADGLAPLSKPRILTSSGKEARMYMGDRTNGIDLDCTPLVNGTNMDLKIRGEVVDQEEGTAVTNRFKADAALRSNGGLVIRAQNASGAGASNVLVLLTAKILSDSASAHFQQRLVRITKPAATNDATGSGNRNSTATPEPEPQLDIKARFISVPQNTMAGLKPFLNGLNPANGQFTEILTGTNMQAVLRALRSKKGVETLGEPQITMLSNRRAEMRTTEMMTVVTNLTHGDEDTLVPQTAFFELGPILDVTPHIQTDGFTVNLKAAPALTEFLGYDQSSPSNLQPGQKTPELRPRFQTQKISVEANLRDGQTLVLGGLTSRAYQPRPVPKAGDVPVLGRLFQMKDVTNDVLIFITATIVTPLGTRAHSEAKLTPGESEIPEQPAVTNRVSVEFSTPAPAQPTGHGTVPHQDTGETNRPASFPGEFLISK